MMRVIAVILTFVAVCKAATFSRRGTGGCETQADVTFMLDSSDIVGKANFQKELQFVADTVSKMDTSPNKTQVSIVTYSSGVYNHYFLNQHPSRTDIMNIPFRAGRSHTADAIRYVTQTSFNPVHGARNNVPHIAVLVTNGPSSSKQITKIEAQSAKDNNIIMYTVGVGSGVDQDELKTVASDPDSRYYMQTQNYGALGGVSGSLATNLCNELPSSSAILPAPTSCLHKADLAFLVDSSTSVGPGNFQKLENFLKQSISKLDIGPDKVHVGLMQYSSYPNQEFPLNLYTDRIDALRAIENIHYMSGGTNTADAIKYMREQMFSQNSGARGNVPRIAIVVTDGGSINTASTTYQADQARQKDHIGLIAVGVGPTVNHNELNSIADSPASQNVITVNSYDQLDHIVDQVLARTCSVGPTVKPMVTAAPGGTLPPDTCVDKVANCVRYGQTVCTHYTGWASANCAKFCGVCQPMFTTASPTCNDSLATCAAYGQSSCTAYPEWAKANCQQFCGFCSSGTSSTGFYGQCFYKGQAYQTGAKWTDACDYDCVCEDGKTGRYKCFNKCPLYHGLPKDCTLIKKAGECCLQPVCNFHQTIQKFESTGKGQTPGGIKVCVSGGKQYYQGQSWEDGCQKQCVCANATEGLFKCDSICPTYTNIPAHCHLDQKPGDCCERPICEYDQQHGSFTGMGTVSGQGIGANPTTPLPCNDRINTCAQYGKDVCTNYQSWASDNCRKFCGICGGEPTPNTHDNCVYHGKSYGQGQAWRIGCDTQCTCENAVYGYYRCDNTCPKYNNLPAGCYESKHTGDCCTTVRCDSGSFIGSTTDPASIGSGALILVNNPSGGQQFISPTQPSGATLAPGAGGTGFQAPTLKGCLFKGQLYVQDQSWEDGCSYTCQCTDDTKGVYSCRPKCPVYPNIPSSCRMETDPNDPCCQAPKCRYDPITGSTFIPIPAFKPAVQYHGLVRPPTIGELFNHQQYTGTVALFGTNLTPAPPTERANTTGGIGYCEYRGIRYTQGQTWEDGCKYNCVCEDSRSGLYRCTEKCNTFGHLPEPYCYLKQDPDNPCCKVPYCNFAVNHVTNTGYISTAKPPSDHCEYKGIQYMQGISWYDGCDYHCTCDDALSGTYRCISRCPAYSNINASCTMVPDPNDPICCNIPRCPGKNTTGNTSVVPTPAPDGFYNGYQGGGIGKCVYKGDSYTQDQTWSDGCDFNCKCVEAGKGHYQCTDKCKKYPNLPAQCRLVSDFTNPCCKKPVCDGQPGSVVTGTNPVLGGTTAAPNPIPTLAPDAQYCTYEHAQYVQGQTWEVGCLYKCRCDDASRGVYVCSERCAKYENLGSECSLVADTNDPCCLAPRCIFPPMTGNATGVITPNMIPTAAPGVISGSINIPIPAPLPGGQTVAPPLLTWCEYKGRHYSQGQKWYDGCDYQCECVSASTGKFKCVERCNKYLNLPAQCRLVKDPANPCCKSPECDFQGVTQVHTNVPTPHFGPTIGPPSPGGPTSGPINPTPAPQPTDTCVYKGKNYNQGQQWYDGCDYVCYCENGPAGVYRCSERCAAYPNLTPTCHLVADPKDPFCCEVPECTFNPVNGTFSGFGYPTAAPGVITGGSVVNPTPRPVIAPTPQPIPGVSTPVPSAAPTMGPGQTPAPTFKGDIMTGATCGAGDAHSSGTPDLAFGICEDVCVYKGQQYTQGQKWQDGCEYNCVCSDAKTGFYQCSERCPRFVNLPKGCTLTRDFVNPCCMKPYCVITPTPRPAVTPSLGPGQTAPPTLAPNPVCMYFGVPFTQGQSWSDGCELKCVCENATTGYFRCNDRCPHYDLAPGCTMITDPRDSCCVRPYCDPTLLTASPLPSPAIPTAPGVPGQTYTPAPGQTFAPGLYPTIPGGETLMPGMMLTPAPGQTYAPGLYPTLPGGATLVPPMAATPYPGYTFAPIPTAPGIPGQTYTPSPGKTFAPNLYPTIPGGQPLVPGMMLTPAPGQTYAPGLYPTLPGGATLVPPFANTPQPPRPHYTFSPIPTAPGIPGQTYTPAPGRTYAPNLYPTVPGGETLMPGMMLTPAPGQMYIPGFYPTLPGGRTLVPPLANTPRPNYTFAPIIPTAPGIPGQTYTPAPGKTYAPSLYPTVPGGQPLVPGMMLTPQPGQTYAPGLYPTLPGGQTLIPPLMYTPFPGYTYAPPIPTAPGIPGQTYTPAPGQTYAPNVYPTVPGGQTLVPGMILTPAPGRTYSPLLYPTLPGGRTLVPPFAGYTFAPIPTAPGIPGQTYTPAPGKTFAPNLYPTVPGGQTLVPGMMLTPQPGQTYAPGLYPTLPGGATLVPPLVNKPYPGFTYAPPIPTAPGIPGQIYTPSPGQTYAPYLYPTIPGGQPLVPGMMLTPAPGQTYAPGLYPTLPGGRTLVPPLANTPRPGYTFAPIPTAPGIPGQTYTPSPGKTYAPYLYPTVPGGETLMPGMMLTPAPGEVYIPGLYPTLPGGQTLVPPLMYTPYPGFTYAPPIPTAPGIPGQTYTPSPGKTYAPGMYPTIPGGQTLVPGMMLTPRPGQTYAPGLYPTLPGGKTLIPPRVYTPYPGFTYAPPIPTAPGIPGQTYTPSPGKTYAPNFYPTVPGGQTLVPGMMLTPAPGQTYSPMLYPTLPGGATLVPPFAGYTFAPIPTAPGVPGQTYTPSPGKTYAPNLYPTVPGGQTLVPGMMLTPQPGKTYAPGLYPTLPGGKTLVPPFAYTPYPGYTFSPPIPTAPGVPGQTYTPAPGQTYAPYLYPTVPGGQTLVPGMMLTPSPGHTYAPGLYPTLPGGITLVPPYKPSPIPTAPGVPGQTYTPSPGQTYAPNLYPTVPGGQTLVPGMMLTPSPGHTYAPGLYPTLPGGNTLVPPMAYTPYPGFTFAPPIPTAPGVPGQTYTPSPGKTYAPNVYPTVPGGQTLVPGMMLTPAPGQTYAPGLYPTLPSGATLVPPYAPIPYPGFTYVPPIPTAPGIPGQTYTPAPGLTYAPQLYPTVPGGETLMPGMMLTPEPGVLYQPGLYPTLPGGRTLVPPLATTPSPGYTHAPQIPTAPGVIGQTYTPAPGKTYAPNLYPTVPGGQTLVPGMMLTPQPGKTYAPGLYPTLPGGQTLIPPLMYTPFPGYTYAPPIPTAPGIPGQTYTPSPGKTYAPNLYPTVPGGQTLVPGMILTPAPGQTYSPILYPTLPGGATLVPPFAGYTFAPIPTAPGVPGQLYTPAPGKTYAPYLYPTVPGGHPLVPGMMLTPQPGKTYAPGLYPTLPGGATLVPPMVNTPYPGFTSAPPIPTAPGIPGQTYTPSPGKTYAPYLYPTVPGGQTLVPGMMLTPRPGQTYAPGLYPTLPGGKTLVPPLMYTPYPGGTYAPPIPTAPGIPGQTYTPSPGKTFAPNLYPTVPGGQTLVPGMVLTPAPGQTYAPMLYPTLPGGATLVPPFAGYTFAPIPTAPGVFGQPYTPAPGQTYAPYLYPTIPGGHPLVPGMMLTPQPGKTYAPGLYPTLPGGKTLVPPFAYTPYPGYTFTPPIPTAPGIPGQTYTPAPGQTYAPYLYPTVPGGQTLVPGMMLTPSPGHTYAPGLYPTLPGGKTLVPPYMSYPIPTAPGVPGQTYTPSPGQTYAPNLYPTVPGGQTLVPGMMLTPSPGHTYAPGLYPTLPGGKTLVPPMAYTPYPGYTFSPPIPTAPGVPGQLYTPAPGKTYAPYLYPTIPGGQPLVPGMMLTPAPGQTYAPDMYPTLPGGRTLVPPLANTPWPSYTNAPIPTAPGIPGQTYTPAPGKTYAPYLYPTVPGGETLMPGMMLTPQPGVMYQPGLYPTLPGGATLVPPLAYTPYPGFTYTPPTPKVTPSPYPVPTAVPGIVEGKGVNGQGKVCVYGGVMYHQGEKWQDGCTYNCECIDEATGRYRCKEKCPLFLNVPSYCRLVVDPNDACCKVPQCVEPTPRPTPAVPGLTPTPHIGPQTLSPTIKETCVFDGKSYTQGQQWYDGCDKTCVCEDAHMGYYRCNDRCAKFPTLPNTCTLTADPKDPQCCKVPQCIPIPGVDGATVNPSAHPIIVSGVTGVFTGVGVRPTPRPAVTPILPPGQTPPPTSAPMPKNECVYKGQAYHQSQKWQDGCDYRCECIDGKTGTYQCSQRCSTFPVVPPQCQMQRDPKDYCCYVPKCDFNQVVPTPAPQGSPAPGSTLIPPTAFCVYNGLPFKQGQVWEEGCSKKCRCDNAVTNYYSCFDRCPSFSNLDPRCVMKTNPNDPCCQVPECVNIPTAAPNAHPTLYPVPVLPPGKITGSGPQVNPNTGLPQVIGFCEYKGVQYHKGDTWDDGCSYTCQCIEETTGTFTCNERCPRFAKLPQNCFMATDPKDSCCKVPSCPMTPIPSPTPHGTRPPMLIPTLAPQTKDVCLYQGQPYTQGQKWFDGCDKKCVCEDAKIGYYTCTDRCGTFTNLSPTCVMVPDPLDPDCCTAPQCGNTNTTNPTGVHASFVGVGRPPTPRPFLAPTLPPGVTPDPSAKPTTPAPKVCVYNGNQYKQGQRWQDGCSYNCVCLDSDSGKFQCTDRCARYPNLPVTCRMDYDPMDPCCQKPNCTPVALTTSRPGQTTPNPNDFCVYNGIPYKQGQTWNVGCQKTCRCDDAKIGRVNCDDRCPSFPVLTGTCSMVTDPNDDCCQVPECVNTNTTNPIQVIVGVPGTITNGGQGMVPNPNTGTRNGCVYKGQYYTQGQKWDDGCSYSCVCADGTSGVYRCTEKCPRYARIPSYCTMVQDSANKCCEKPYCTPLVTPTPKPSLQPGQTPATVSPIKPPQLENCNYNGQMFKQGQLWYVGCSKICHCENAQTNFIRCQDRCAKYTHIGAGCTMVPDSRDPACCEVPDCPLVQPSVPPTPGIFTPVPSPPGLVDGFGKVPTPAPKPTPSPQPGVSTLVPIHLTPIPGCMYKGQIYGKGVTWDDGCTYRCECLDSMTGRYQCSERCQRYDNIPKDTCVLIADPKDNCCKVPFCDFLNLTPFPNGIPTPRPAIATSAGPGAQPTARPNVTPANPFLAPVVYPTRSPSLTPAPNSTSPGLIPQQQGFCEYKGVYYTQGQTWTDGCEKVCRCEAPAKGYFQCSSRCPSYNNLSSSCVLKTNPSDPCCLAPDCNQYPTPRPNLPPVPGASPTTPIPIYVPTAVTGSFIGTGQNPNGITGGGINFCVFKGKVYSQGMTWDDGCNYKCTCADASRGFYRCNDRCPQYYQLPWQCHYEKDPKDTCCQTAKCDFNLSPTPSPTTPKPITMAPTPHGWTGPTLKPLDVCLYIDNTTYTKGQTWDVGCDFRCVCDDPTQNNYTCTARCQVFSGLPSVCNLIPDPMDKCCETPSCGAYLPVTVINGTATPPPNTLNVIPVGTHNVIAGSNWGSGSGTHPVTGKRDKCIYKGKAYSQSQSWDDGCLFTCACEDAERGIYRCTSKCPAYPPIPNYCHKVTIPGQCCPSLSCDVPGFGSYNPVPQLTPAIAPTPQPGATPTPKPTGLAPVIHVVPGTTLTNVTGGHGTLPGGGYPIGSIPISGIRTQCVYKSKLYNQGESWDDDCDFACKCLDGRTGYYECKPKCPAYPDLPSTCFLVKSAGSCCRVPQCAYYGVVYNPVEHPELGIPVVGQFSGGFTGFKPGTNFSLSLPAYASSGTRNVCIYKGVIHHQNDKWDDGCDFSCICDDASTGHYQCRTKCVTFARLPSYCSLVTTSVDCCKKLHCDPTLLSTTTNMSPVSHTPTPYPPTPTPDPTSHCLDAINNCGAYGKTACSKFSSWAKRNCQAYCDFCPAHGVSTGTPLCSNKLPNCHEFGYSQCTGIYTVWAKDNCADYCGLCPGATHWPTTTATTTTTIPCVDALPNCQDYVAANFCNDLSYRNWTIQNCANTCGLCPGGVPQSGPSTTVGSVTSGNGWLLLMKGVAGVPGNLYQLWSGNGTMNPNVGQAMYLTNLYPGHFKPDLSNNWGALCLDKVKVSIYNKGVEKAWIIFNATGTDKMGWFTKDRIIDSSWTDIKTAASQFSMPGVINLTDRDPSFGRQFYASGNSNGCDSTGWMMISTTTTNPCFFELGNKPAFYYAPGQTQARWSFIKPGTGDVFAIQAHSTCPSTLVVPTHSGHSNGCNYKGHVYHTGDNWVDNCQYNCTCDSDITGHYTCNDLCPVYTNLPSSIKLEKVPGECCEKIVFTGTFNVITAPPNLCFYKGNSYGTGEKWDDACDYKCECLDAATGNYRCTQKCVTWNLPPVCHLDPPATGKCCKTPSCPSFVHIQYPSGYTAE